MGNLKQFIRSETGKVRELGCPYEGDSPVVELEAIEYVRSDRCLCSYCWGNRTEWRYVESAEWIDDK